MSLLQESIRMIKDTRNKLFPKEEPRIGQIPVRVMGILEDSEAKEKLFQIITGHLSEDTPLLVNGEEFFVRRIKLITTPTQEQKEEGRAG